MGTEPRVRDFTDHDRRLPVWVDTSPIYELLLGLFTYSANHDAEQLTVGSTLIERIESDASAQLKALLDELAGCGGLWLTLLGVARSAPHPHDVDTFVSHLKTRESVALRRQMLRNAGYTAARGHDETDLTLVADGDAEAVGRLLADSDSGLRKLFALPPDEMRDRLVDLICRVNEEVDLGLGDAMAIIERDAAATKALAAAMEPADLVERVTNGVTFEPSPGLAGVVLIPSLVISPWVVISEHGNVRIFSYPVSEEALTADPATPPSHLVDIFKALGDERRLRILFLLAAEPRTLGELAEKIQLAKSTAHHHMAALRQAGLVRVVVGEDEKRYQLRSNAVPEASALLETYIAAADAAAD